MPLALFVINLVFSALISSLICRDFQLGLLVPALPQLERLCHRKPQIGNISATYANLSIMFFQKISHNLFEKDVEEAG